MVGKRNELVLVKTNKGEETVFIVAGSTGQLCLALLSNIRKAELQSINLTILDRALKWNFKQTSILHESH